MISLAGKFRMPERLKQDPEPGMFRVYRYGDYLMIEPGDGQVLRLSEYNAARLCATLALFLNLRFIKRHMEKLTL
jgi:hypothetical protein